ncbi:hypothetical protein GGI07_002821 [Coemansia sp. Benny D115]|nr:hypothetical protein GGI07_002821 [Coemansia sp. Benny D115]
MPANSSPNNSTLLSDAQCVAYREEAHHKKSHSGSTQSKDGSSVETKRRKARLGDYACIEGSCRYVVKAGELCSSSQDCAAYQLNRRWAGNPQNNSTNLGADSDQLWCAPQFCTLESTCGGAWTLPDSPLLSPPGVNSKTANANGTVSCCRGFIANTQCGLYSGSVDTCASGFNCVMPNSVDSRQLRERNSLVSTDSSSSKEKNGVVNVRQAALLDGSGIAGLNDGTPTGKCVSQEPHQQVWIGVLLVLIGGATLNVGLNLQKYAFRKQQEKADADNSAADSAPASAATATGAGAGVTAQSMGGLDGKRNLSATTEIPPAMTRSPTAVGGAFFYSSQTPQKPYGTEYAAHEHHGSSRAPEYTTIDDNFISEISNGQRQPTHTRSAPAPHSSHRLSYSSTHDILPSLPFAPDTATEPMLANGQHQKSGLWKQKIRSKLLQRKKLQNTPFGSPLWSVGLIIFILGNVVNFVALQFAPQSLVAPLGAVSLVTNVIVAPLLNKEKISMFDVGGIALIIAGCVIVVVFSGIVQQDYRLCVLIQLLKAKPTVLYLCLIFAAILGIYVFLWTVERGVEKFYSQHQELEENSSILDGEDCVLGQAEYGVDKPGREREGSKAKSSAGTYGHGPVGYEPVSENPLLGDGDENVWATVYDVNSKNDTGVENGAAANPSHTKDSSTSAPETSRVTGTNPALPHSRFAGLFSKAKHIVLRHPLVWCLDPYIRTIRPTSRYVKYGLPLAYASLGSFMATLTTLFAKSLVNLLSVTFFDHENQFNSLISWVILLVTAFTAASQVYWINQGLLRYDALLQVPVFYVVWTVFDIIGGGVYFNEFKDFTTVKYVLFALGVAVIFSGVGLLSHRMKSL